MINDKFFRVLFLFLMQIMPWTSSEEDNKRIIMDLDVVLKSYDFPYIVRCLGYFIRVRSRIYRVNNHYDSLVGSVDRDGNDVFLFWQVIKIN